MKSHKIKTQLFLTILVLTLLPMTAALIFWNQSLETSLNLGFNKSVAQIFKSYQEDLRVLAKTDPKNQSSYREKFENIQDLMPVYADPGFVKSQLQVSFKTFFLGGVSLALLISLLAALVLSRRISFAYQETFRNLLYEKDRVRDLEEISNWQDVAKRLAHEIKNPLTPIEVMVTNLERSFESQDKDRFAKQLRETQEIVHEEIGRLKELVTHFSDFARLPNVNLEATDIGDYLEDFFKLQGPNWTEVVFGLKNSLESPRPILKLDRKLFRQVLHNIITNAIEANPGKNLKFHIISKVEGKSFKLQLKNDGVLIPKEDQSKIFSPYFSTKRNKSNMGLGLSIVKKLVIDHGGDIKYEEESAEMAFVIRLPLEETT